MKKTLTLIAVCLFAINYSNAQKRTTHFSIAADAAVMTTQQAYKAYNLGFGGSGKMLFPTGKKNYFTGTVGVLSFAGRAGNPSEIFGINVPGVNIATPGLTIIPVKTGYKYFVNRIFNTEVEVGYTFASVKKVSESITGDVSGINFSLGFSFLVAKKLDIGMRYEQWRTTSSEKDYTSFLGLRTLVQLDFNK